MRYLLDTSIISKRESYARASNWILAHQLQIALPVFAIAEIQQGIERLPSGTKRRTLEELLSALIVDFPVLPFDSDCAFSWARYVQSAGRPLPLMDSLIAAMAIAYDLELVTDNEQDFPNISIINPMK